ncbi:MAG: hypothetical protein PHW63_08140 [Alphaproteobacteria bacterium]|nr:hypothetical protein [Alphaproteobacteria bacterium]
MVSSSDRVSSTQMLVPMTIMALTVALFFAYQLTQIMNDRSSLNVMTGRIEAPYNDSQKLNNQFGGLVVGTKKLAEQGNASAKEIVKRLEQLNIIQSEQQQQPAASAVPVKDEEVKGPVKP